MSSHGTGRHPEDTGLDQSTPLPGAPYSPELLADLHAGVLPESVSDRLWPVVRQDHEAMQVIAALDAVTARLAQASTPTATSLSSSHSIPPEVAERLDRALADAHYDADTRYDTVPSADVAPVAPFVSRSLVARRHVPRRFIAVAAAVAVVAAAAVGSILLLSSTGDGSGPEPSPNTLADAPTLVVSSDRIDSSVVYDVMSSRGGNDLTDSGKLRDCLVANGFSADSTVVGSSPIELDGQRGVMLVIPTSGASEGMTLLAVASDCGIGSPNTLLRRELG
nr:hypothetical protein [Rhodococcus sp. (in: high G+C Gram-positive bacteria)]